MNPEDNARSYDKSNVRIYDSSSNKSINEVELEAATNATFDSWTQGARNLYKGARKLVEDLDDHSTLILTDIFGSDVAKEHSRRLEVEAKREADAGHVEAANHFKRRDLNISRSTLGENDSYTLNLSLDLKSQGQLDNDLKRLDVMSVAHPCKTFNELLKTQLGR
jgi:hypothetical protein